MKYSSFLLGSLLLAGTTLSTCSFAQDEAPDPRPQAQPATSSQDQLDDKTSAEVSEQVRKAMRDAQKQIERVQTINPGFAFYGQSTPEMAKKTREITVLRQMVALKLSARDLERAIPLLKQLRETDKAVPAKPEQALDEEYNALLHAKPGDPMPPSSSEALRDASKMHREEKQAIWDNMQKAIGKDKTAGIRQMLGSERFTYSNGFGTLAPSLRALSSSDGNVTITGPDGKVIERHAAPLIVRPADPDVVPAAPVPPADAAPPPPRRKTKRGDSSPNDTAPPALWVGPGARAQRVYGSQDLSNRLSNLFYFNSGQVSLDELIDLMEKKLAAMK